MVHLWGSLSSSPAIAKHPAQQVAQQQQPQLAEAEAEAEEEEVVAVAGRQEEERLMWMLRRMRRKAVAR